MIVQLKPAPTGADLPLTKLKPAPNLYRVVWRWHFYAGMLVAPLLLVSAITGSLYVFKSELSDRMYAGLYFVEPAGSRLSYEEQLAAARRAAGDLEIEGLILSTDPRRSTQFVAHVHPGGDANPEQQHRLFFIDPYTGRLLGSHVREETFFSLVLNIHRTLLAGSTGRCIVELAACWGIVLLFTGLYLWWPRGTSGQGVWRIRLWGKPYAVLRDLHAVSGIYVWAFVFLSFATGLFFTRIWGTGYQMVMEKVGQPLGPVFAPGVVEPPHAATAVSLDATVAAVLRHSRPGDTLVIETASEANQTHTAFVMQDEDAETLRVVRVDPYTAETVNVTDVADMPPMVRAMALALSLHQGKTFGLASKIVALLTCLGLAGMVVTGLAMWWARRPAGTFGLPRRPDARAPWWLVGLIVLLGVLLPVVGASMLLILLGEWTVRRGRKVIYGNS